MLGVDFLKLLRPITIDYSKQSVRIGNRMMPLGTAPTRTVTATEDIVIPPNVEVIIPCEVQGIARDIPDLLFEPEAALVQRYGLYTVSCLVQNAEKVMIPLRIMNISRDSVHIYKHATLGTLQGLQESYKVFATQQVNTSNPDPEFIGQIQLNSNPTHTQRSALIDLFKEFHDIFAKSDSDLGKANLVEHHINTGDATPIKQKPYRIPLNLRYAVKQEINRMLDIGVVEPSTSPWASPIVVVAKKDGKSIRLCVRLQAN